MTTKEARRVLREYHAGVTALVLTANSCESPEGAQMIVDRLKDMHAKMPFDLKLKSYEGNCDLCFLKSLPKRVRIAKERPDLVKWWADWEERKQSTARTVLGAQFKKGQPMSRIVALSQDPAHLDKISNDEKADIPCSCVERGMEADDSV